MVAQVLAVNTIYFLHTDQAVVCIGQNAKLSPEFCIR
jgi:hypothetical protein